MPSNLHRHQELKLKNYFVKNFPDYEDATTYKLFGDYWVKSLDETPRKINLNGSEPDLVIIKNEKIIYVGEAKQINDFSNDFSRLLSRGYEQLENYFSWMIDQNKCVYETKKIVYSVPFCCKDAMKDSIRKIGLKYNSYIPSDVIDYYE